MTKVPDRRGLRVERLSYAYGNQIVLHDVSFEIPHGQVWGLVGRSGVGKTTLLNLVLGLYRPCTGTVSIDGKATLGPGRIRGAVLKDTSLLPWLTVVDNVLFPNGVEADRARRKQAERLLVEAGLSNDFDRLPKELSAGMVRRVELIRALMLDDEFFVADEPFAGLDVHTRLDIHKIWMRLHSANPRTGILCTHDPAEALLLCNTILVMRAAGTAGSTLEVFHGPGGDGAAISNLISQYRPPVRALIDAME